MENILFTIAGACIGFATATILNYKAIRKIEKDRDMYCDLYVAACQPDPVRDATVNAWAENNRKFNERTKP